jgi:hypothetical protein
LERWKGGGKLREYPIEKGEGGWGISVYPSDKVISFGWGKGYQSKYKSMKVNYRQIFFTCKIVKTEFCRDGFISARKNEIMQFLAAPLKGTESRDFQPLAFSSNNILWLLKYFRISFRIRGDI